MKRTYKMVAMAAVVVALVVGVAAAVLFLTPTAATVFGQSFSVGYVDMPRLLESHPRRAASEKALQEFFQAKQREFQDKAKNMAPPQRQQLDRQLQQQILQKRQELLGGLDKDIRTAIAKVARDRTVSVVLDRSVVLYGGVDLTEDVIKLLQQGK
ncbi:MAG: OmpH family outer membrane protein [Armatimonadetes bacterium]|nr:OmpH family outer membrane protein [Armatimonadota bacterium]